MIFLSIHSMFTTGTLADKLKEATNYFYPTSERLRGNDMETPVDWILMVYKIPPEPTKYRASVWREIKRLGGLYLQGSVCVFPDIDDVLLNVHSLADLIRTYGGTEYTFVSSLVPHHHSTELIASFREARDEEYRSLLTQCENLTREVGNATGAEFGKFQDKFKKLQKDAGLIKARDYFGASLGVNLRKKLDEIRQQLTRIARGGAST